MMTSLFVTMQDPASRRWAPVARLTRENGQWCFGYTEGARTLPGFEPFGRFTDLDARYVSDELFPLFANRVLPRSRPEYHSYLGWLGLTEADPFEELSRTGGLRATDDLELITCPEPTPDQRYTVPFFARGLRHLSSPDQAAVNGLAAGDCLYLLGDLQNPVDPLALLLRTGEPMRLAGYVPRYYAEDFNRLLAENGCWVPDDSIPRRSYPLLLVWGAMEALAAGLAPASPEGEAGASPAAARAALTAILP